MANFDYIEKDRKHQIFAVCVYGFVSVLIIAGNSFCLVVLKRVKHFIAPTKLFVISLTTSDLCMGLCYVFPLVIKSLLGAEDTKTFCFVANVMATTFHIGSGLSLLLVNMDRYLAIEFPLSYLRIVTVTRARIILVCLWSLNGVILLMLSVFVSQGHMKAFHSCSPFPSDLDHEYVIFLSIHITLFTIIPFVVTVSIYGRILFIVRRLRRVQNGLFETLQDSETPQIRHRYRKQDRKALNTFLMVTFMSSAVWIPFSLFIFFGSFLENSSYDYIETSAHGTGLCMFWINIMIYTIRDRSFRTTGIEILCCIKR